MTARHAAEWLQLSQSALSARRMQACCAVNNALENACAGNPQAPTTPAYWIWYGDNLAKENRPEEAIRAFKSIRSAETAASLSPFANLSHTARWSLAHQLKRSGDVKAAIEAMKWLHKDKVGDGAPGFTSARWAECSGDLEKAQALYRITIFSSPTPRTDSYSEQARRALARLRDGRTARFRHVAALIEEITGCLSKRASIRIDELLSRTHFSCGPVGGHPIFESDRLREELLSELTSAPIKIDGELLGSGEKRYLLISDLNADRLRGEVYLFLTLFPDGWQWTGFGITQVTDFWRERWTSKRPQTNQPLPFEITSPWPSDYRFMAGGLDDFAAKSTAVLAAGIFGPAVAYGFSRQGCGYGPRGFYYNQWSTHEDEDAFAIDFTRYKRGKPFANRSGGTPVLAVANGMVTVACGGTDSGDGSDSNTIEIIHRNPATNIDQYLSRYLHLAGPDALDVSAAMAVFRGQKLGFMNDTGNSAFDHLHFSIHDQNVPFPNAGTSFGSTTPRGASVRPAPMDGQTLGDGDSGRCLRSSAVYSGGPMTIAETTDRVASRHWLRFPVPALGPNVEYFVFSGIGVFEELKGEGSNWAEGSAGILADYGNLIGPQEAIKLWHWTVNVDLSSLFNQNVANNTGWSVNEFTLQRVFDINGDEFAAPGGMLRINSQVAIRDIDAYILRLSYNVSILGEVARFETPPVE